MSPAKGRCIETAIRASTFNDSTTEYSLQLLDTEVVIPSHPNAAVITQPSSMLSDAPLGAPNAYPIPRKTALSRNAQQAPEVSVNLITFS